LARTLGGRSPARERLKDGLPAEPPTLSAAVPNWSPGDVIALGRGRALRVVAMRDEDADSPPVLVVEAVVG